MVTVTVAGSATGSFTATVTGGVWSITVPAGDITPDATGISVTADVDDAAGNSAAPATAMFDLDTTADDGVPLSVSFDDTNMLINSTEMTMTPITIAGLDADATGTLTIMSAGGGTLTVAIPTVSADGTVMVDLSGLNDGALTATLTVTDDAGNMTSASGNSAVLDTSSDADAATLSIVIDGGDTYLNDAEDDMASYTVAGLDGDVVSALVTFSDGNPANTVTATITANGTYTANLSGLNQGNISVSIVATDVAGNSDGVASDSIIHDILTPVLSSTSTTTDEYVEPNDLALAGEVLETFSNTDGSPGGLTYTFDGGATTEGGFTLVINGGNTELRVADPTLFDFEDDAAPSVFITVTDAAGNFSRTEFTVNLMDLDDAPEITPGGDIMATVTERADVTTIGDTTENDPTDFGTFGSIEFTDDDITDSHSVSVTNISSSSNVAALNGSFIGVFLAGQADPANGDGEGRIDWTFGNVTPSGEPNEGTPLTAAEMAIVDSLGAGEYIDQVFRITVTDFTGTTPLTTFQDVTIRLAGTNDAPVIEVDTGAGDSAIATIPETDAVISASGTLSLSDVDTTDIVDVVSNDTAVAISGTFTGTNPLSTGDLQAMFSADMTAVIDGSGTTGTINWTFDSTNADDFDFLAVGETLILTYTVTATDDSGATNDEDTQTVTITITGTNDEPSIDAITQADVNETIDSSPITATINATFDDADLNDIGHSATITDAVASGVTTGLGSLDLEALIASINTVKAPNSDNGTITLAFSADSTDFDYLAMGEVLTLTYTVELDDGDGGVVTRDFVVEITGTNDMPSVADASGAATEDGAIVNIAFGAITDVDLSNTHTYQITSAPSEGSVGLGTDGVSFDFDPGADFQDLAMGQTRNVTFTYTVTDNDGGVSAPATATVTVTGTNDAPTVTAMTDVGEIIPEGNAALSTTGSFNIEDVDTTDVVSVSAIVVTPSGNDSGAPADLSALFTAELNDTIIDGTNTTGTVDWTFDTMAGDFDYLAVGESVTLTYAVTISDDNVPPATVTQNIVVTITGTNDAPTVTDDTDVDHTFGEGDAALSTLGSFDIEDLDVTDVVTVSAISASASGTTTGAPTSLEGLFTAELNDTIIDGTDTEGTVNWIFNAAAGDFDYLAHDESIVITYTVTISDDETGSVTQDIVITINGTNDQPVISVDTGDSDEEDLTEMAAMTAGAGVLSTAGTLTLSDDDTSVSYTHLTLPTKA